MKWAQFFALVTLVLVSPHMTAPISSMLGAVSLAVAAYAAWRGD